MSMVIQSFDHLHDNRVLCYCADFEAHILHVDTRTEAGENVSVHFTGLLAHWFENVIRDNILFGMDEITVDGFFEQYKDLLGGTISYGFPACCSIEELRERMDREHIRVFNGDFGGRRMVQNSVRSGNRLCKGRIYQNGRGGQAGSSGGGGADGNRIHGPSSFLFR